MKAEREKAAKEAEEKAEAARKKRVEKAKNSATKLEGKGGGKTVADTSGQPKDIRDAMKTAMNELSGP